MNTEVDDEIWHGDWLVEYTTSALDGDHHHLTIVHGQTVASAQAALFEEIKRLYSDQGAVEVTSDPHGASHGWCRTIQCRGGI